MTLLSSRTLRPTGISSSLVSSSAPIIHFTYGMGAPTATQVRFTLPPGITSWLLGGMEKRGATRRTAGGGREALTGWAGHKGGQKGRGPSSRKPLLSEPGGLAHHFPPHFGTRSGPCTQEPSGIPLTENLQPSFHLKAWDSRPRSHRT